MNEATVIYPHQLIKNHPGLAQGRPIYLVEEPLLLTYNPIHRQKLLFHLDTLDYYEQYLLKKGYVVHRLLIKNYHSTSDIFNKIKNNNISIVHIVDTTDDYLERAILKSGLIRIWYESPLFILPREEAKDRFVKSKRFMANFYKQLRIDKRILITAEQNPVGGKWSFDNENRKLIPQNKLLPEDITVTVAADRDRDVLANIPAEQYGEAGRWLPTTHRNAEKYLADFLKNRLSLFGDYEDAIHANHTRLWHSTLSPLLNVGLLTPKQVLDETILFAEKNNTPINSLEGFVRQILGWREFIRASYECDGHKIRNQNFFNHTGALSSSFWTGTTNLLPLDHAIKNALRAGYTHHIERLMVMGNGFLLLGVHPDEVYRWFMGMYIDAYDWVMVPNVYGMSQFADGGSFATKPYISGANYLRKMSNYPKGDWEEIWTALFWYFINQHQKIFLKNHRLRMMPQLWQKLSEDKKKHYLSVAKKFIASCIK